MNQTEMIVGIIGIAASTLFGLWGVYLAVRKSKYPGSLTYILDQSVSLVDDLAKKLPSLEIKYKNAPLNRAIVLLNGYLVNDGSIDISKDMVESPLECILPDNCKFLELSITNKVKGTDAKATIISNKKTKFQLGLFRRGESISFQSLILLDEKHSYRKANEHLKDIAWNHRIANLGKVKQKQIPSYGEESKKSIWFIRIIGITMGIAFLVFGGSFLSDQKFWKTSPRIHYNIMIDGKYVKHIFKPNYDGTTTIYPESSSKGYIVNLSDFIENKDIIPIQTNEPLPVFLHLGMFLTFFIGGIVMIYGSLGKDIKKYRLRKLVETSQI